MIKGSSVETVTFKPNCKKDGNGFSLYFKNNKLFEIGDTDTGNYSK